MLSKNPMVRKAIESLYDGVCTIYEQKKIIMPNKSTQFTEIVVAENIPCRLSYSSFPIITNDLNAVSSVEQNTKLFIAPEVRVKAGSKISVTQNEKTTVYKSSGEPAMHSNHQEINVELFERWS